MTRKFLALSLMVFVLAAVVLYPAQAAPAEVTHQMIASVLLRQGTNEAQVTLSVVDQGPSKKFGRGAFRRGVILADDAGRMIAIRGDAVLVSQGRTFQVFEFSDMHIDMPGKRVIRVTHISLHIMTGDYAHPNFICGSPSLSIDACLGQWHPE